MSKQWTEEERRQFAEKMKKARQKKSQERVKETKGDKVEAVSEPSIQELLDRIAQLERGQFSQPAPQVTTRGVVGTVTKYTVDKDNYPSPVEKLKQEPRLKQFAFDINYELEYEVNISTYETKDGMTVREPRFNLQLNRVVFDDDGNPTDKRYIVRKMVMHEDPQTALTMARDRGLEIDESREADFLNEMRYLRVKDWLMDIFYPKPAGKHQNRRQEVIGGRLVEVFDVNSESAENLPFNQLNKML